MEKKIYYSPLIEVEEINLAATLRSGSPTPDNDDPLTPSQPGAPARRGGVPVF